LDPLLLIRVNIYLPIHKPGISYPIKDVDTQ